MGASGGTPLRRARGGSGAHMISRIVAFALQQRFITLAIVLVLTGAGIVSFARLPIEAYPDVADVEVDVITLWPGHAAEEVERHITLQLEKELNGIAGVTFLRSFSNFGLSNVRILFADGTDNYWARQQVQERIAQAEIPADAHPQLGPLASVIGEVYRYTLHAKTMPLVELKALQDWVLEREFRSVPGVVDVVSWGGGIKQYQITVEPSRLRAYNLTLKQVFDAVSANNANAGGSSIRDGQYALMVRGIGLVRSLGDLESIVIAAQKGTPVRVRDIGQASIGHAIRFGVLGRDDEDDLVQGIVLMRKGENPGAVLDGVKKKLDEIRPLLPAGVEMRPYYSRDRLVSTTVATVMRNLVEGALLVTVLLSLFLYNMRAALIVALVIPLSLLFRRAPRERESPFLRWMRRPYARLLSRCVRRPLLPLAGAVGLFVLAGAVFMLLGKEFLPELDEGDAWLRVKFPVGISLEDARPYVHDIRMRLLTVPEVRTIVSQLGAPDDGTDPNGPDTCEFYIGLKPREVWSIRDKDKIVDTMAAALDGGPGITTNFSQPIKDNVDEALAGVKGEFSIKIFGPDVFTLEAKAKEIANVLGAIQGVADLDYEHLVGQPQLQIVVDRKAAARYGINIQDVQDAIEA